jgi:hypothetical protein
MGRLATPFRSVTYFGASAEAAPPLSLAFVFRPTIVATRRTLSMSVR